MGYASNIQILNFDQPELGMNYLSMRLDDYSITCRLSAYTAVNYLTTYPLPCRE